MKTFLSLCLLLGVASVHAQTMVPKLDQEGRRGEVARQAQQRAMEKFDRADDDKDGKLSRQEAEKHLPYLFDTFDGHDKDRDGFLSWEEYLGHNRWPR